MSPPRGESLGLVRETGDWRLGSCGVPGSESLDDGDSDTAGRAGSVPLRQSVDVLLQEEDALLAAGWGLALVQPGGDGGQHGRPRREDALGVGLQGPQVDFNCNQGIDFVRTGILEIKHEESFDNPCRDLVLQSDTVRRGQPGRLGERQEVLLTGGVLHH